LLKDTASEKLKSDTIITMNTTPALLLSGPFAADGIYLSQMAPLLECQALGAQQHFSISLWNDYPLKPLRN
jgi:hypothetical protein